MKIQLKSFINEISTPLVKGVKPTTTTISNKPTIIMSHSHGKDHFVLHRKEDEQELIDQFGPNYGRTDTKTTPLLHSADLSDNLRYFTISDIVGLLDYYNILLIED